MAHFGHGTTVATNAMLERRGARTAYVATRGFADVPALGRQARPHLYRPEQAPPAPLAEVTAEVDERMGPAGVLQALRPASVAAAARRLRRERVEAIAVCLLHAYADPSHEQAVAAALRSALPDVHVVASHEVAAEFREFERASTTIADAYLGPVAGRYLRRLAGTASERGPARAGCHAVKRRRLRRRTRRRRIPPGCSCRGRPAAWRPWWRRASPTRSASTWAAPRPTSA